MWESRAGLWFTGTPNASKVGAAGHTGTSSQPSPVFTQTLLRVICVIISKRGFHAAEPGLLWGPVVQPECGWVCQQCSPWEHGSARSHPICVSCDFMETWTVTANLCSPALPSPSMGEAATPPFRAEAPRCLAGCFWGHSGEAQPQTSGSHEAQVFLRPLVLLILSPEGLWTVFPTGSVACRPPPPRPGGCGMATGRGGFEKLCGPRTASLPQSCLGK